MSDPVPFPPEDDLIAAGLLEGLDGSARDERLELLEWLFGEGFTLEDVVVAHANETLVLMASERAIGGHSRYTEAEVAERSGVDPAFLRALERANGIRPGSWGPDARVYTDIDVESAKLAQGYRDAGLSEEQILGVARVLGRGLGQIAEHLRQMIFGLVARPGATELELARSYQAAASQLAPQLGPLLEVTLSLHLRQAVATDVVTAQERSGGELPGAREIVVAFADLVGFTRMGQEVPPEELGAVAGRLEDLAEDVVEAPVRVVKTIGDAVLLVSTDAQAMVAAGLALIERAAAEGEDFPQLRVGVARGHAVNRAGDWFGAPVNLASRVTGVARAGSVLATEDLHDDLAEAFAWSFAGAKRLKNVSGEVKLFRARPPEPAEREPQETPEGRRRRERRSAS